MNDSHLTALRHGVMPEAARRVSRRRILVAGLAVFALFLILVSRLFYLQVVDYDRLALLSQQNRIKNLVVVPVRGRIFDRNGQLLVGNKAEFKLEIVPDQAGRSVDGVIDDVARIISIDDAQRLRIQKSVSERARFEASVIQEGLEHAEVSKVAVEMHRMPGVAIQADLQRHYLDRETSAHVLGRVGRISQEEFLNLDKERYGGQEYIGKTGVEILYEDDLVGWPGLKQVERNAHGRVVSDLIESHAESGKDLYLTIDRDLQRVAYESLTGYKGAAVAMDPSNGQILAMASSPSYDPNDLVGVDTGANFAKLRSFEGDPLLNRATQGTYSPGSIWKVFLGLAVYEIMKEPPRHFCPGFYQLPGKTRKYRCWKEEGHGLMTLSQAIEQSCDVYFYKIARSLGIDEMHYRMSRFGFGEKTQVGLPSERDGILPSTSWKQYALGESWYEGETLSHGIGQGFTTVTALQLAHAVSIIAERGDRYKPQVLLKKLNSDSGDFEVVQPQPMPRVNSDPFYFESVVEAMVDVIHGAAGTARSISRGIQYRAAGKTGTVQLATRPQDVEWDASKVSKELHPHGIFVAFAPVDDPKIVVAVIAENSESATKVAVPAVRKIMDQYLLEGQET